ncbi:hypothetical protein BE221DRAFT_188185 [Ostreococcus tauri]|uniref:CS domain-containing protein n=1 Tax=Ostreococcus tauri TaxID=70448 RepID=A0A1Y5HYN3_OSTTA|nr:hypothetical protein BE221DRAFT_188185 [Ostreococcus tauri]
MGEDDVVRERLARGLLGASNDDISVQRLAFRYVFVPWDETHAMEERVMVIPAKREMECLLDALRIHFRKSGAKDGAHAMDEGKQKEILKRQLERGAGDAGGGTLTDEMMDAAMSMQMAQPVPLMPGSKRTGHVHVNMYVDDRGISKGLPTNARASALSAEAGSPQQVLGDAFIARIFDDDDRFMRLDFTLDECSSDAAWMKKAKALALERSATIGDVSRTMAELSGKGAKDLDLESAAKAPLDPSQTPGPHQDFEWSQDEEEVTLKVRVPAHTTKADVTCVFGPGSQKLSVRIKTLGEVEGKSTRVVDNEGDVDTLFHEIVPDESSWSLVTHSGERAFEASLVKRHELKWLSFLTRGGPPETTY